MKKKLGLALIFFWNLAVIWSQRGDMRGRAPMDEEYGDSGDSTFSGLLILVLIFVVYHFGSQNKTNR